MVTKQFSTSAHFNKLPVKKSAISSNQFYDNAHLNFRREVIRSGCWRIILFLSTSFSRMQILHLCLLVWSWGVCVLQLCAAGKSQTRLVWCCLLIGLRPMTRGKTASGASMWKRTRGSCLTSKCKRLHSSGITQWDQKWGHTHRKTVKTSRPVRNSLFLMLSYDEMDTPPYAHGEVFLQLKSLISPLSSNYIKNSV